MRSRNKHITTTCEKITFTSAGVAKLGWRLHNFSFRWQSQDRASDGLTCLQRASLCRRGRGCFLYASTAHDALSWQITPTEWECGRRQENPGNPSSRRQVKIKSARLFSGWKMYQYKISGWKVYQYKMPKPGIPALACLELQHCRDAASAYRSQ